MPRREPSGAIFQPYNSGSGEDDGIDFVRCVGGRQPKIHEVWNFGEDRITPEVNPFACIDVGDFVRDCFATDCLTENVLHESPQQFVSHLSRLHLSVLY